MNNPQHQLLKVTDSLPEFFFFYDPVQRNIVFSNQPPEIFFGSPIQIGERISLPGMPEDTTESDIHTAWQQCLELKSRESSAFAIRQQKDQKIFNYQFTATGTEMDNGRPLVMFFVKKDQPEQPDMEAKLKKEFNELVDLAAHDLDAPLRKLSLLIENLEGKYEKGGTEEVKPYVKRINKCLADMRSLVDSMATLSRVGNGAKEVSSFGLEEVINEAVWELGSKIREKRAVVNIATGLPVISGKRDELRLLFRQLLDNAILFSRQDESPIVDINSEILREEEKEVLNLDAGINYIKIRITDNGIGILPPDAEKIFLPFVRLHGKSEFAGNGIGLAICKKIVDNHGGILFAEKREEQGAGFILIIPQTIINAD